MTNLGTIGSGESFALGINNRGQVIGGIDTTPEDTHAFLWERGVMTILPSLGGTTSTARAINERGQVAGYSSTATGETHAVLWERGARSPTLGT